MSPIVTLSLADHRRRRNPCRDARFLVAGYGPRVAKNTVNAVASLASCRSLRHRPPQRRHWHPTISCVADRRRRTCAAAACSLLLRHAGRTVCANDLEIMPHLVAGDLFVQYRDYTNVPNRRRHSGQDTVFSTVMLAPAISRRNRRIALTLHRFSMSGAHHTRMASTAKFPLTRNRFSVVVIEVVRPRESRYRTNNPTNATARQ